MSEIHEKCQKYVNQLGKEPKYILKSIIIDPSRHKYSHQGLLKNASSINDNKNHSLPSTILTDWLYLGEHKHAKCLDTLKELEITNILNISRVIPNYYINSKKNNRMINLPNKYCIDYARVPVTDFYNSNLFDYFKATSQYIDMCHPKHNKSNNEAIMDDLKCSNDLYVNKTKRILVHCQMGQSRSATVVIAYLLSHYIELNAFNYLKLQYIRAYLDNNVNITEQQIDIIKDDFVDDITSEINIDNNGKRSVKMTLSEAYYFVQSCRNIVLPNIGFCHQLAKWERIHHNGQSTLMNLPYYNAKHEKLGIITHNIVYKYYNKNNTSNSCYIL